MLKLVIRSRTNKRKIFLTNNKQYKYCYHMVISPTLFNDYLHWRDRIIKNGLNSCNFTFLFLKLIYNDNCKFTAIEKYQKCCEIQYLGVIDAFIRSILLVLTSKCKIKGIDLCLIQKLNIGIKGQ